MQTLPVASSLLFTKSQVPGNCDIAVPSFCSPGLRDFTDHVVAFMLRYYYIDEGETEYADVWRAFRPVDNQGGASQYRFMIDLLKRIEGFDLASVQFACDAMGRIFSNRFNDGQCALLAYHTLTNAFQALTYLSAGKPVYGYIDCEYGQYLGITPATYATRSFLTNGVLAHVVCVKKGLSRRDIDTLILHYVLATESRLTHAGTEQLTDETGDHYITHLAIVLATGKMVWKMSVGDLPLRFIGDYKAALLANRRTQLKGRL